MVVACAAPAIIRPGLLMPVKPALVPGYTIAQFGVDVKVWGRNPVSPDEMICLLDDYTATRGLVRHNEALPMPPGTIDGRFIGPNRFIPWYNGLKAEYNLRLDALFRDYNPTK